MMNSAEAKEALDKIEEVLALLQKIKSDISDAKRTTLKEWNYPSSNYTSANTKILLLIKECESIINQYNDYIDNYIKAALTVLVSDEEITYNDIAAVGKGPLSREVAINGKYGSKIRENAYHRKIRESYINSGFNETDAERLATNEITGEEIIQEMALDACNGNSERLEKVLETGLLKQKYYNQEDAKARKAEIEKRINELENDENLDFIDGNLYQKIADEAVYDPEKGVYIYTAENGEVTEFTKKEFEVIPRNILENKVAEETLNNESKEELEDLKEELKEINDLLADDSKIDFTYESMAELDAKIKELEVKTDEKSKSELAKLKTIKEEITKKINYVLEYGKYFIISDKDLNNGSSYDINKNMSDFLDGKGILGSDLSNPFGKLPSNEYLGVLFSGIVNDGFSNMYGRISNNYNELWVKYNNNKLNDDTKAKFSKAGLISPEWYCLDITNGTACDIIDNFMNWAKVLNQPENEQYKKVFNYICNDPNGGYAKAYEYLQTIADDLDKIYLQQRTNEEYNDATHSTLGAARAGFSVIFKPFEAIAANTRTFRKQLTGQKIYDSDTYLSSDTYYAANVAYWEKNGGPLVKKLYEDMYSVSQVLLNLMTIKYLGGGKLTAFFSSSFYFGGSAFNGAYRDARSRNVNQDKSFLYALACSGSHTLAGTLTATYLSGMQANFNNMLSSGKAMSSIEQIVTQYGFKPSTASYDLACKALLSGYCMVNSGVFASTTAVNNDLIRSIADIVICGDMSQYSLDYKMYKLKFKQEHGYDCSDFEAYAYASRNMYLKAGQTGVKAFSVGAILGILNTPTLNTARGQKINFKEAFDDTPPGKLPDSIGIKTPVDGSIGGKPIDGYTVSNDSKKPDDGGPNGGSLNNKIDNGSLQNDEVVEAKPLTDIEEAGKFLDTLSADDQVILINRLLNGNNFDTEITDFLNTRLADAQAKINAQPQILSGAETANGQWVNQTVNELAIDSNGNSISIPHTISTWVPDTSGQADLGSIQETFDNSNPSIGENLAPSANNAPLPGVAANSNVVNLGSPLTEVYGNGNPQVDFGVSQNPIANPLGNDVDIAAAGITAGYGINIPTLASDEPSLNLGDNDNNVNINLPDVPTLFKKIAALNPFSKDGKLDLNKLKIDNSNNGANDNQDALNYLFGKLPEFFTRGVASLNSLYDFCKNLVENGGKKTEDVALQKLSNGDISDIEKFKELYPALERFAKFLPAESCGRLAYRIQNRLFNSDSIIPDSMKEDYLKFKSVYEQIIADNGMFKYNNIIYYNAKDLIFDVTTDEKDGKVIDNKELLVFAYKVMLMHDLATNGDVFDKYNPNQTDEYGLFNIEEFATQYKSSYLKEIRDKILPMIKDQIEKKVDPAEQPGLNLLLDIFAANYFSDDAIPRLNGNPLVLLGTKLSEFKEKSFDEAIKQFTNSIITILNMTNVMDKFERTGNKDLYTLLNIIRSELSNVPTDENHGELSNAFRKVQIRGDNDFMDHVIDYRNIESFMEQLNEDFKDLMQIDDTDEYIKMVGIIWYKFMLCHPYEDGNGRTGRYLLNTLLAHKNIVIPALYNNENEQIAFEKSLDKYILNRAIENIDYDGLGNEFLQHINGLINGNTTNIELKKDNNDANENQVLRTPDEILEAYMKDGMDKYSKLGLRSSMDENDKYSYVKGRAELLKKYLGLAKTPEDQKVLAEILLNGGYNGFSFDSSLCSNNNRLTELARRLSMATLYLTNPEAFKALAESGVNMFHGTNSSALSSILDNGLNSVDAIENSGKDVLTGEYGNLNQAINMHNTIRGRDFVSFTDVLDLAYGYSSSKREGTFKIIIGTTADDINNSLKVRIGSDLTEVGVKDNLSVDKIKVIIVPADKVELVKSMVGDRDIKVLSMDGYELKGFSYFDDLYISDEQFTELAAYVNDSYDKNLQIIDVSKIDTSKSNRSLLTRGVDPNIMNISYAKYDYVYKTDADVDKAINRIIADNKNGNILLEINDTKGLTDENLAKLPDNVRVRVLGDYGLENFNAYKNNEGPLHILDNVTYTVAELKKIMQVIKDFEKEINPMWNDETKARHAANFLAEYIRYRGPGQDGETGNNTRASHFDGLTNLLTKKSTCQGFAHTYRELLTRMGIPCYEVCGSISGGHGQHAFNVVTIDGKNIIVDLTRNKFGDYYNDLIGNHERIEIMPTDLKDGEYYKKRVDKLSQKYVGDVFGVTNIREYKFKSHKYLENTLTTIENLNLKKTAAELAKILKQNEQSFEKGQSELDSIFVGIKSSNTKRAQTLEQWAKTVAISKINEFFGGKISADKFDGQIILLESDEFDALVRDVPDGNLLGGLNSGKNTFVRIPKSTLIGVVKARIIHEILHHATRNDSDNHDVSGFDDEQYEIIVDENGNRQRKEIGEKYKGFNESTTEYFAWLIMPEVSNSSYEVGYYNGVQNLIRILNLNIDGFDLETLKKQYLANDIAPLKEAIDKVAGEGFFENELMRAFDASVNNELVKIDKFVYKRGNELLDEVVTKLENKIKYSHTLKGVFGNEFAASYSPEELKSFIKNGHLDSDGFYKFLVDNNRLSGEIKQFDFRYAIANQGIEGQVVNTGAVVEPENIIDKVQAATAFSEGNMSLKALLLNLWDKGYQTHACCSGHEGEEVPYVSFRIYNEADYKLYQKLFDMLGKKYRVEIFINGPFDYSTFAIYDNIDGNGNEFFNDILNVTCDLYVPTKDDNMPAYVISNHYDSLLPEGYKLYINNYTGEMVITNGDDSVYIPLSVETPESLIKNAINRLGNTKDFTKNYAKIIDEINSRSDNKILKVQYLDNFQFVLITQNGPVVVNLLDRAGTINPEIIQDAFYKAMGYNSSLVKMTFDNPDESDVLPVKEDIESELTKLLNNEKFIKASLEDQKKMISEISDYDTLPSDTKLIILMSLLDISAESQGLTLDSLSKLSGNEEVGEETLKKAMELAEEIANRALNDEPQVTEIMKSFEDNDCILMGTEKRLKAVSRIAEKIISTSKKKEISLDDASKKIKDALRYTLIIDPENYTEKALEVLIRFKYEGYEIIKASNTWDSETYKGLNTLIKTPDGTIFEIQFHTPDSYVVKDIETHLYYEIVRNDYVKDSDKALANEIQRIYNSDLLVPPNIIDFDFMEEISDTGFERKSFAENALSSLQSVFLNKSIIRKALKNGLSNASILGSSKSISNMIKVLKSLEISYVNPDIIRKYTNDDGFDFAGFLNYLLLNNRLFVGDINKLKKLDQFKEIIDNPDTQLDHINNILDLSLKSIMEGNMSELNMPLLEYTSFLMYLVSRDSNFRVQNKDVMLKIADKLDDIFTEIIKLKKINTCEYKGVKISLYGEDVEILKKSITRIMNVIDNMLPLIQHMTKSLNEIMIYDIPDPGNLLALFEYYVDNSKFEDFDSAGSYNNHNNVIKLYNSTFITSNDARLLDILNHEDGHLFDKLIGKLMALGDTTFTEMTNIWGNAKESDNNSVTKYGDTFLCEDFAEMCMKYAKALKSRNPLDYAILKKKYPARVAVLEKLFTLYKGIYNFDSSEISFYDRLSALQIFEDAVSFNPNLMKGVLGDKLINQYNSLDAEDKIRLADTMKNAGVSKQFIGLFLIKNINEFLGNFNVDQILKLNSVFDNTPDANQVLYQIFNKFNNVNPDIIKKLSNIKTYSVTDFYYIRNICSTIAGDSHYLFNIYHNLVFKNGVTKSVSEEALKLVLSALE